MSSLTVLNPVALSAQKEIPAAGRVADLDGKRVGLYWNMKAGGDVALEHVRKSLSERYPSAQFEFHQGEVGAMTRRVTEQGADRIAEVSDVIVGTTGDCGSCTSWLIRDLVEFEKRGVPAVAMVARGFVEDTEFSARTFGLPNLSYAVAESTFTSHSPDQIRSMVDLMIDDIVEGLTSGEDRRESEGGSLVTMIPDRQLEFKGSDSFDAFTEMNAQFLDYGWGDGFPLYPPTPQLVEAMLKGTSRDPESIVAILEPGFGIATVEMIAANAVMAGCEPEHLPVVIAAVEAIADPRINLRGKAMSTGSAAPMIAVNGPIRDRIGLNYGCCALGPGKPSKVNTVIGRALRLCMMNIGHTYPGVSDMDTTGTPNKYSMCLAENEEESPWEPYHVSQGFDAESSTVTVHFNYGYSELHDFENHEPEALVKIFASAAKNRGSVTTGFWLTGRRADPRYGVAEKEHNFILVCPEHAEIFARAGWSREDLQREVHRAARLTFKELISTKEPKSFDASHPELAWLWDSQDTLLPVLEDETCYDIMVVGATAGRSQFHWGCGGSVVKQIEEI